jgi:signal transduction histidine kinase/DNA-binding response OmpR family regulator
MAGILEDDHQNLWIETLTSIIKFNPHNQQVLNFNFHYGNLTRENYSVGCAKDSKGYMYFGGINGLISFHPDSIREDSYRYPIALTDFQILDRSTTSADAGGGGHSPASLTGGKVSLDYHQYGFSFAFSSLNYKISDRISYAFKLEGIDEHWIYRNANQRFASYSNLNPGTYTLKVKATNEYGIWSGPKELLTITILTPWWKTWWAYLLYTLTIAAAGYGLVTYVLEKERLKHSLNLERLEKEKVKEVDELKFRYFTNISHEFRTPLTLISGPLEQISKYLPSLNAQVKGNLMIIQHNVNHLLRLINQLMDFRKAEEGSLKLAVSEGNITEFIQEIKDSFDPLAQKKTINFILTGADERLTGWCDFDKLEKILNNLIYNALSFSPEKGQVTVNLSVRGDVDRKELILKIQDNGEGIPDSEIDKIFNPFYQASNQKRSFSSGYGIGLSLTKQLADLHKGEILVSSSAATGTVFTVSISIDRASYKDFEISKQRTDIINRHPFVFDEGEQPVDELTAEEKSNKKPLLLLVDDNAEIRKYLVSCFKDKYRLTEAANGAEGLQKAETIGPDLIISDVMMPEMDGKEFCYKVKTNLATSHIPVILLTALMSTEHLIQGLETGADAYITKPFNYEVLEIQVRNLIESRRNLRKHFVHEAITQPQEVTVNSIDEVFLAKAMKVIEDNIKEFDYSIDQFVDDMAVGRSVLYRKLKQLTDQSPNEFIRTVRLKRAAQLLKQHSGTISEIGYEVGFIDPGYFARCFKKQFNLTPKEFISEHAAV